MQRLMFMVQEKWGKYKLINCLRLLMQGLFYGVIGRLRIMVLM